MSHQKSKVKQQYHAYPSICLLISVIHDTAVFFSCRSVKTVRIDISFANSNGMSLLK